jgi:hypothetical protein
MTSTEKVRAALDHMMQADDEDLGAAIPGIPPTLVMAAMPFLEDLLPSDPAELDDFLTRVGDFCHSMRSDRETAQSV